MKKLGPYELVLDSPVEVAAWVDARIPDFAGQERSGGYQAIGLARRGRLIAGFLFHNMQPNRGSVEMTAAGLGAFLRPEVVAFMTWNAFENLGCAHLMARTAEDNLRARRALEASGFLHEGTQRKAWDGERNTVLYGMTKNDGTKWRPYLEEAYGRQWEQRAVGQRNRIGKPGNGEIQHGNVLCGPVHPGRQLCVLANPGGQ